MTGFGVLGTAALLGLAACPADLANPSDYDHAGSLTSGGAANTAGGGNTAGTGGGGSTQPGLNVSTKCLTDIFAASCSSIGCHAGPAAVAAARLDLSSANVNTRLIDVLATHELAPIDAPCVAGQKLIDSANPDQSWLVRKLTAAGATCGSRMPIGPELPADEMACVTKYAQDVATAAKAGGM
ncbi:MAG: hypothetical protein ABIQ16_17415 [Polyangiaceae bacterium]